MWAGPTQHAGPRSPHLGPSNSASKHSPNELDWHPKPDPAEPYQDLAKPTWDLGKGTALDGGTGQPGHPEDGATFSLPC